MPRQLEGSRAVAEAVALCRPEVICAYPISPQTHIVENLSQLVKAGELAPCEFVNVESEFAAMSVVDRRLGHRRARLHRDRQPGPAVHGRGALQRLGARAADRDDRRQPRDRRADQHLERPQRLDVPARLRLDPALRRDQPGGARPAHPGVPPRRGALHAGDGVHGRLHPHARRRARRDARAGAGRRVPAAVPAAPGARPRRADHDRRDGRAGGVHGGQVPRARQADAGARADPRDRRATSTAPSDATPAG